MVERELADPDARGHRRRPAPRARGARGSAGGALHPQRGRARPGGARPARARGLPRLPARDLRRRLRSAPDPGRARAPTPAWPGCWPSWPGRPPTARGTASRPAPVRTADGPSTTSRRTAPGVGARWPRAEISTSPGVPGAGEGLGGPRPGKSPLLAGGSKICPVDASGAGSALLGRGRAVATTRTGSERGLGVADRGPRGTAFAVFKSARLCGEVLMGETATLAPDQQHLRALQQANRVRLARAEMKREIAAGDLAAADVILSCPWQAHSMSISDLLMSQKRWGRARCRRLLTRSASRRTRRSAPSPSGSAPRWPRCSARRLRPPRRRRCGP